MPMDIIGNRLYYSFTTGSQQIISLAVTQLDYGEFSDYITGSKFRARELYLQSGIKSTIQDHLSYGLSVGYVHSRIASYQAAGIFLNAGIRGRMLSNRFGFGISVEKIGQVIRRYRNADEEINPGLRYSFFYKPLHLPGYLFWDIRKQHDLRDFQAFGVEISLWDHLTIRLSSSNEKKHLQWGGTFDRIVSGISMGIGWEYRNFHIEFAQRSMGPSGSITGFSISFFPPE